MVRIPETVQSLCHVTPMVLAEPLGCFLKLESLQRTGSVKLRGAALKLARMSLLDRASGVITASAGNHGLGLACAGRSFGVSVKVVMPETAPRIKREGISSFGAEIVRHGASYDDAEKMGRRLAALRDTLFISPFDDADVMEGNGAWLGREMLAQKPQIRRILVPIGGGGLAAGLASELVPESIEVIGVQPRQSCAMAESIKQGRALTEYPSGKTLCEELEGGVGWRSFRAVKRYIERIELVEEEEIINAVVFAYKRLGLVIEASAAVVLAVVLAGRIQGDDKTALVVSGGNIDFDVLDNWLQSATPRP